jgi:hypothetical protein
MRLVALERMHEGESPATAATSLDPHRDLACKVSSQDQGAWQTRLALDPAAVARWEQQTYPGIVRRAKREKAEIYFWDESGFRADAV